MSKCKRWVVSAVVLHRIGDAFTAVAVADEATGEQRVAASIEGRTFNSEKKARKDIANVVAAVKAYCESAGLKVVDYEDKDILT